MAGTLVRKFGDGALRAAIYHTSYNGDVDTRKVHRSSGDHLLAARAEQ